MDGDDEGDEILDTNDDDVFPGERNTNNQVFVLRQKKKMLSMVT